MHLSMSSASCQILSSFEMRATGAYAPNGRTWEVMVADQRPVRLISIAAISEMIL